MTTIPQDILQANSSLTLALEAFYHGSAHISVLSEAFRPSTEDEVTRLKLGDILWERQILLSIGERPLLYGLTRVAKDSVHRFTPPLDQLGDEPLGYWLFQQPSRVRLALRLATLKDTLLPRAGLYPGMLGLPPDTLTRESMHVVEGHQISVVELIMV